MRKITRVLVVDDSVTMRAMVGNTLKRDPEIEVVGFAQDAQSAREAVKALDPDVITLDIELPGMDGLSFLEKLMRLRPVPVVMVSSLTSRGAEASIKALELGAFDCIQKPDSRAGMDLWVDELSAKVKAAARSRVQARRAPGAAKPSVSGYVSDGRIVCIGSSTGGVEALLTVLANFPQNCPPTLIVQHMPATFTTSFARRLNDTCAPSVAEAFDGAPIEPGRIWLAPGDLTHLTIGTGTKPACRLKAGDTVSGHRPSVDVLFQSAVRLGSRAMGVILTGMGRDGAAGLLAMREAGATTLGQDEETSLIYGMPKVAHEYGAVERQFPLDEIGSEILRQSRASAVRPVQSSHHAAARSVSP